MLPLWVQWLQAILILVISGLGSWIAYKQVRIASAKLNLDLYDKRFEVFESARNVIAEVLREGNFDVDHISAFNLGVADAVFVESEVKEYLDGLRKSAVALHTKIVQLSGMNENDRRRNALIDGIAKLETQFATEHENLVAVFKPYLKLGNI